MQQLQQLWLPILIASTAALAIYVFAWYVFPFHAREHHRLPTEPAMLEALRREMPPPGIYSFPYRGLRGMSAERADVVANLQRGPVGYLIIGKPGAQSIVAPLLQHFFFLLLVVTLSAYIAIVAGFKDGTPFIRVFRLISTVSTMSLVLGTTPLSIWFSRPWKSWALQCVEGLACGLATGATFGWLWPQ